MLSHTLLHLQRGDVLDDVVKAKGNNSQMAQDVLGVNADRCRVSTQIDEGTTRTAFCLGQHTVSESQRSKIHLSDINLSILEALVEILVECLALQDVQEVTFDT